MVDNIDPDLLKNGEIFDFDLAANTYYFPVDELIEDGFQDFINNKLIGDFTNKEIFHEKRISRSPKFIT